MEVKLHLNEFFVEGGNQATSHVLLHVTEPSTPAEQAKGYFFAVAELNNAEPKQITKLQSLIDEIENNYYEAPGSEETPALEVALEKVNQQSYALRRPNLSIHCVVGAVRQPEILFSTSGNPQTLLFYKTRQDLYQRVDLLHEATATEAEAANEAAAPPPLFSQLIQGKLSANDYLLVATPHVSDYFTADRLQKIITTRPARQSAEHLTRVLGELRSGLSFGGFIVQLRAAPEAIPSPKRIRPVSGASAASLQRLVSTEQQTAETLSSALWPRLENKLKLRRSAPAPEGPGTAARPLAPAPARAEINAVHTHPHRPPTASAPLPRRPRRSRSYQSFGVIVQTGLTALGRGIWWFAQVIGALFVGVGRGLALLFVVATNLHNRRRQILETWQRNWQSRWAYFAGLPFMTKISLAVVSILILASLGSAWYVRRQRAAVAATATRTELAALITAKKDAAESALLYHDETTAWNELNSAEAALARFDCTSKEAKTDCDRLDRLLREIKTKLQKMTTVAPALLTDAEALLPGATLTALAKMGSELFAGSPSSTNLFSYNLVTRETRLIPTAAETKIRLLAVPKEQDYLLLIGAEGDMWRLTVSPAVLKKIEGALPSDRPKLSATVVYNRRLYSLDLGSNQIYKHEATKAGFNLGQPWIKNTSSSLADAVDLTIDGDVFVLKQTGEIIKFSAGVEEPFVIEGLDPAIQENARIHTYTDLAYLYVLDGAGKRLIVLEKTGRLKGQFTAAEFNRPTDFIVDEPNKTVYIVDGSKLWQLNLP